jgi:hypothetical protein
VVYGLFVAFFVFFLCVSERRPYEKVKTNHSNDRSLKQISNRLRGALLPAFAEN